MAVSRARAETAQLAHLAFLLYVAITSVIVIPESLVGRGAAWVAPFNMLMIVLAIGVMTQRAPGRRRDACWLPLLGMPVLYWQVPLLISGLGSAFGDAAIQGLEAAVTRTQPAAVLAGAMPSRLLSEVLHLCYLSYYLLIVVPPAVLWIRGQREAFATTVLAATMTFATCYLCYALYPVAGPRFLWEPPPGIPVGPLRSVAVAILEMGSMRGTAFPSSHVAVATVQCLAMLRWQPAAGRALVPVVVLMAIGAVYGGFHYLVDVVVGAGVGGGIGFAVVWGRRSPVRPAPARATA